MNVTGVCIPCKNIIEAATVANTIKRNINESVKVGKEGGNWYVVIQGVK